jgi:hypothetical protein
MLLLTHGMKLSIGKGHSLPLEGWFHPCPDVSQRIEELGGTALRHSCMIASDAIS